MSEQDKRKSYLSIFDEVSKSHVHSEEKNGHPYLSGEEKRYDDEDHILTDELDHEILMHRETHFGGDFGVMLAYYQEDNIGIHPNFDIERIAYLAEVEAQLGQNLAPLILSGPETERVAHARRAYENLKEIYEHDEEKSPIPRLIADLILTESEEPKKEIEAIVSQGTHIVPELLQIVQSEDAYDPLFPGYGFAPYLAIICLGKIKDPSSIIPLFETLGREMVFEEEVILAALAEIGESAKSFLLNRLKGRPITQDTVNAAFALAAFADHEEVAIACLEQLNDPKVIDNSLLRSYLLNNCAYLQGTPYQEALVKLAESPAIPSAFRKEIENMIRDWK